MHIQKRVRCKFVFLAFVISVASGWSQEKPFTLEQVMNFAFPTDLVAAKKTGGFAWVSNARGSRNIWVAEPPDFKGRQITNYTGDDGQDVGELEWSPDGKSILYTRGGDLEFPERSYPNAATNPAGVEQDVWMVSVSGGAPRKLSEGRSPAVSPDGKQVAFIFKDQIWSTGFDPQAKAAQLIHSEGRADSLRWSPDGSRVGLCQPSQGTQPNRCL